MDGRTECAERCTVSVIIPVYNTQPYLRECIDSVLHERDFPKWQVLLVDDGSTDGSVGILREYAEKYANISVLGFSEPPLQRGPSAVRNLGLRHARGQYVFFLDSDDVVLNDHISRLYDEITGKQCDIAYTGYSIWQDGQVIPVEKVPLPEDVVTGWDYLERRMDGRDDGNFVCFALYRTTLFTEAGVSFDESIRLYEDVPFTLLAAGAARRVCVLPSFDYLYRIRFGSLVHSGVQTRDVEYAIRVLKLIVEEPKYHAAPVAWRFCYQVTSMALYYIGMLSESGQITGEQRRVYYRQLSRLMPWKKIWKNARTLREKGKWLLWRMGGWRLFYLLVKKGDR